MVQIASQRQKACKTCVASSTHFTYKSTWSFPFPSHYHQLPSSLRIFLEVLQSFFFKLPLRVWQKQRNFFFFFHTLLFVCLRPKPHAILKQKLWHHKLPIWWITQKTKNSIKLVSNTHLSPFLLASFSIVIILVYAFEIVVIFNCSKNFLLGLWICEFGLLIFCFLCCWMKWVGVATS